MFKAFLESSLKVHCYGLKNHESLYHFHVHINHKHTIKTWIELKNKDAPPTTKRMTLSFNYPKKSVFETSLIRKIYNTYIAI